MIKRLLLFIITAGIIISCGDDTQDKEEQSVRERNLRIKKEQAKKREPCDTLSFQEYFIANGGAGNYIVEFDQSLDRVVSKPAVFYYKEGGNFIFSVIAKSKQTERNVEVKNIVGVDASFLNYDSTRLGTAFFFLTLYECDGQGNFSMIWEKEIPIHTGFNSIKMKKWKNISYIELNFIAMYISGNVSFNLFFVDGLRNQPHLLETYEAIARQREIADVNNDKWPDYFEWRFAQNDSAMFWRKLDSIPFIWDTTKNIYRDLKGRRWTRKY
ncbi:MAG: hypothetical protein K9I71_12050 [Ignavibacteriales bacterium]|nr:hypothetical protein [Ignavibacteriales bacterium]MCF8316853.1 hypothetical protein [Ignavibacteriales bacterium]MCF8438108.1 hypothetical protein [Ignavibacteriales bacterium]